MKTFIGIIGAVAACMLVPLILMAYVPVRVVTWAMAELNSAR